MLVFLLLIVFAVILFAFTEESISKYKWQVYITLCICLIIYAGFRPVGFDRDSTNYELVFLSPDSNQSSISVEPFFLFLCKILYPIWTDVHIVFLIFATLGVTMKFVAIKRLTPLFFLPILIYLGNFFILHDMTQIRAGVASGLFLLAIKPMSEGKKLHALCYILVGVLFHYSALALIPLLFLSNKPIGKIGKGILAFIVPACFVLYVFNIDILLTIPIPYISDKIEIYKALNELGLREKESIFNPFPLMKMAVFLYFLYYSETIKQYLPSIYLIIKILGCSLIAYFSLMSLKIVSMRLSELYGIVELVAYPCIIYTIRPQVVGKCIVCIIAFIEILFNLVVWGILDFDI